MTLIQKCLILACLMLVVAAAQRLGLLPDFMADAAFFGFIGMAAVLAGQRRATRAGCR